MPTKTINFETNIVINHLLENLTGAIAIALYLKEPIEKIKKAVKNIPQIERAINIKRLANITVIDDSYNSTPQGFEAALIELNKFEGNKVVLTSGIAELGPMEFDVHKKIASSMKNVNKTFLTNPGLKAALVSGGLKNIITISDKEFFFHLKQLLLANDSVLLIEGRIPKKVYDVIMKNYE